MTESETHEIAMSDIRERTSSLASNMLLVIRGYGERNDLYAQALELSNAIMSCPPGTDFRLICDEMAQALSEGQEKDLTATDMDLIDKTEGAALQMVGGRLGGDLWQVRGGLKELRRAIHEWRER